MEGYTIKSRIWIESGDKILLGEGRVKLLKAIEKEGSVSKGASSIGLSYKKAWRLVDAVNKAAKEPVVITSIGGKKGGGTIVTDYGKELITRFDTINHNCWSFLDEQLKMFNDT
ncbi:MAG: molybdenum transporter [Bacteroidota bacterium]